jgi:hypothetical protein
MSTPAYRYGQLSRAACEAELTARQIPFRRERALGVLAPVRLSGPLRGVWFRGEGTDAERAQSPHEIVDCRLVLALDDCAEVLLRHDIVEVRHFSMYRLPPKSWPRGRAAELPSCRATSGSRGDRCWSIHKEGRKRARC